MNERSRRVYIVATVTLVLAWWAGNQYVAHMDDRFFQLSQPGIQGLALYLIGDYSGAAEAYRAHFSEAVGVGSRFSNPGLKALTGGDRALLRGDLAAAKRLSQEVLADNPDDTQASLTLGEVAIEENTPNIALTHFEQVLSKDPSQFDAHLLSSIAHTHVGAYGNAIDSLKRAFRLNKADRRITSFLTALRTTGELAARQTQERPLCLLAHYYRYLRIHDHWNARAAWAFAQQAIAAGDRPDDAYLTQGVLAQKQGEMDQALAAFLKAVESNPQNAEAYRWSAIIYKDRGDDLLNEYRMWKGAFQAAPEDEFYIDAYIQFLRVRLGDIRQALTLSLDTLGKSPENLTVLRHTGKLYEWLQEPERAIEYYRKILVLRQDDPQNAAIHVDIGANLQKLDRIGEAVREYQIAMRLNPDIPDHHLRLAGLYSVQYDYDKAIHHYKAALRMIDHPAVLLGLCTNYHFAGKFELAAPCLRKVLARDPTNRSAGFLYRYTKQNLGRQETQR